MTTSERRQRILSLLREQPGVKVTDLAKLLNVSEGTIRNDLTALEKEGLLTRVRGGATLQAQFPLLNTVFSERVDTNAATKQCMARQAVKMIEEGDAILMDASSTVFHLVPLLHQFQNLTIITNGIQTGLTLAQTTTHTVILVGGIIRADGVSIVGQLGEKLLADLNIKIAFMSCSGFSLQAGLTEIDIREVQIKKEMIRSAQNVIAIIDSSKFDKTDLTSFASVEQVSHIITDGYISPKFGQYLRQHHIPFTLCEEEK